MPEDPSTPYEIALGLLSSLRDDVERSCRFYTEVLGGSLIRSGEPSYVSLANSWIIINVGGGPTDDKPSVRLEIDQTRIARAFNIRVSDIQAVYADWTARGAEFLTPPKQTAQRDPLLRARTRWLHHRSRPDHAAGRLEAVPGPVVRAPPECP